MESESKTKVKSEVKDGYVQLAEKMEQVRTQMAKMERKYDELYQTVKEKEHSRNPSVSSDQAAAEASKSARESVVLDQTTSAKSNIVESSPNPPDKSPEEAVKTPAEVDLEKMEDNPFL